MKSLIVRKILLLFLASFLLLAAVRTAWAQQTSTNWAGYIVSSTGVTGISASWSVPGVQCANTAGTNTVSQGLSVWIGFDGTVAGIPEQVGTNSYCFNGNPGYWAWEEDPTTGAGKTNHAVGVFGDEISAGEHITASITYSGNNHFQLKIADSELGDSRTFNVIISNAPRTSAEWIVEAFTNMNTQSQVTLPKFQPITFSDCTAAVNNVAGSVLQTNAQSVSMVDNNGNIIVQPQNLNQAGTSFQVAELG